MILGSRLCDKQGVGCSRPRLGNTKLGNTAIISVEAYSGSDLGGVGEEEIAMKLSQHRWPTRQKIHCMVLASALLAFGTSANAAQEPNPGESSHGREDEIQTTTSEAPTILKVNVNLVLVRVVVRNGQGRAIGGLRKEDFELFDNGKPQAISKFTVEGAEPGTAEHPVDRASQGRVQPHDVSRQYVAYLFDDIHLEPQHLNSARNAALAQLEAVRPGERLAVYTTSELVTQDFTDDRGRIREALLHLRANPVASAIEHDCPNISYYQADLIVNKHDARAFDAAIRDFVACTGLPNDTPAQASAAVAAAQPMIRAQADRVLEFGSHQSQLALMSLLGVVRKLAVMPGQRTVSLVSPGFLLAENLRAESTVIERALASSVTISSLDARGLYTSDPAGDIGKKRNVSAETLAYENQLAADSVTIQSQVLSELTNATGGIFFHNSNDLEEGFRRIIVAPEYCYVLGFVPQQLKYDGKYHSLRVALKDGRHYTLQARSGYYAPNHEVSIAEQAKSDVEDAVFSQDERLEVPLELNTQFFKPRDGDAKLAVFVRIDVRGLRYQKVDGRNLDDLTVVSAVFDRNGNFLRGDQKTVKMRLTDDTLQHKLDKGLTLRANFDVKPGTYQVRCVVRDNEGKLSARNLTVDIP